MKEQRRIVSYIAVLVTLLWGLMVNGAIGDDGHRGSSHHAREKSNHHRTGAVRGVVVCDAGGPVAGAIVAIPAAGSQDTTDSEGRFRIHHLPAGTYDLTISIDTKVVKTIAGVAVTVKKAVNVGTVGVNCSGACAMNADCPAGTYCAKAEGLCSGSGVCSAAPVLCTQVYDPVCGCDGTTFSNACVAGQTGMNILSTGACQIIPPPPVFCSDNGQCESGLYCVKAEGSCSTQGTCGPAPTACAQVFEPVCGCNGTTYANACEAAAAGVVVAKRGACVVTPPPPTACSDNTACAATEYCAKTLGDCTALGVCTPRPSLCAQVFDPVCGCNGTTYPNECGAATLGIAIASTGSCTAPPLSGCLTNAECLTTQYCSKTAGNCGGTGSCTQRPGLCAMFFDPVVGCDGKTYPNSCEAASAGVNVK